ncbi:coproporphyrinogen III oxidase [Salimicrobium jeotgali]|uniref:Heme chaperone HemW n=1 Tax=Salimicrobium jeotgali TaxID=1230341 RepID=K2GPD2_9BACI|nr:radical SAM family heme chaperone HemW [Salimicrobium jeotgali]AKG04270.1 coproporphyrinogen III oxidase [Salimicrobium jeotgali]EKE32239.1 coproporphyrinogen III oxidase [Salimicrobium jeotgali]MBM7695850.1 oxygen-independent coproporphyrinogen-3 oxidase [Salimicrobium jeotgali]
MKISSAYIHIPFCQQICHYCDFVKFFYDEKAADQYLEALEIEMDGYVPGAKQVMKTIYVGGGTPTVLTAVQLEKLLKMIDGHFDIDKCEEYTFEANPGDLDQEKADLLAKYGVNRISLGVQTFDNTLLEELGRVHKEEDVYLNIDRLRHAGIDNISIDLMYGLPNQSVELFEESVDKALELNLPHYSSYSLQIEPKTVFHQRYKKGELSKPPEEDEVEMYHLLQKKLREEGIYHYEISNFSRPGYESEHNLTYWDNAYYYGIGAGAHGYLPGKRTINIRPLPAYLKKVFEDGKPVLHEEPVELKEMMEEEMFLGLRKMEGVSRARFKEKYDRDPDEVFGGAVDTLIDRGLLEEDGGYIKLTEQGKLFGNDVFASFLID